MKKFSKLGPRTTIPALTRAVTPEQEKTEKNISLRLKRVKDASDLPLSILPIEQPVL